MAKTGFISFSVPLIFSGAIPLHRKLDPQILVSMSLFGLPFLAAWTRQFRHPKTPSIGTFLVGHLYLSMSTTLALSAHTAVAQLKRSFPAKARQDPGASQNSEVRMAKISILSRPCRRVSCVGRYILRDQLRDVLFIARACLNQRIQGSNAVAEPSLGVLSLVLGTFVGRRAPM